MGYLFTSESVSEGHPDKIADQISDALVDAFIAADPDSKVACETLVTTGLMVCSGEIRTKGFVDIQKIARNVVREIGYTNADYKFEAESCGVISTIHDQSDDIFMGVERGNYEDQGAGDQGMMFGYAINEMDNYMPLPVELANILLQELAAIRKEGKQMKYLRPDSKSQVTVEYDGDNKPIRIDTIVISTQHDEFIKTKHPSENDIYEAEKAMQGVIREDVLNILFPRVIEKLPLIFKKLFNDKITLHVNPTGKFVIGGPHGDTGLTGRKIIVDTYGGKGAHGGGAFSGKDPSKVDRSAAYATRHIAKNLVAAGIADEILVQVAYAIGVAKPVGLYVNTFNTCKVKDKNGITLTDGEISSKVENIFDMRPGAIIQRFGLKNPIYLATASYGHFGRDPFKRKVQMGANGNQVFKEVEFFAWEKLDYVAKVKKEFGMK
ncbi:MAG TPA: methionine adenosyltransferase [Bacteroidales bacterium]|nr:methionine adenosyltransferase [Bacteroidales bacterium]